MSSIVFEGNTYTFGATVSANPGTGTTSYVFGGLNAGQTYGFIIWAFNGFGNSNIVGPTNLATIPTLQPESREIISAFAYSWGLTYDNFPVVNYYSGSTLNMFFDSENMSSEWWGIAGATRTPSGVTLPNGRNNGIIFTTPSGNQSFGQTPELTNGLTYVMSFYINETLGSGGIRVIFYYQSTANIMPRRQILPVTGGWTAAFATSELLRDPALTGWVRYAFEILPTFGDSINTQGKFYITSISVPNVTGIRNYYIGSPQLERLT